MDLGWTIGFDRPWLLLLLLALPPMIYLSLTSLAGLGPWRKIFAILLRCLCVGLIVCSLAQMKWQRKTDQLTVLYLLDQSASITPANRKLMLDSLGLAPENDFATFGFLGNTGSAALPSAFAIGCEEGFFAAGNKVAWLGIGSGINSTMMGINWNESRVKGGLWD